jgi:23S rRNA-/tRNA-specific pseudouridylate synthase
VERRFDGYASIVATPLTDATHQVRAHLAAVGFPLAVDPMYGDRTSL